MACELVVLLAIGSKPDCERKMCESGGKIWVLQSEEPGAVLEPDQFLDDVMKHFTFQARR